MKAGPKKVRPMWNLKIDFVIFPLVMVSIWKQGKRRVTTCKAYMESHRSSLYTISTLTSEKTLIQVLTIPDSSSFPIHIPLSPEPLITKNLLEKNLSLP